MKRKFWQFEKSAKIQKSAIISVPIQRQSPPQLTKNCIIFPRSHTKKFINVKFSWCDFPLTPILHSFKETFVLWDINSSLGGFFIGIFYRKFCHYFPNFPIQTTQISIFLSISICGQSKICWLSHVSILFIPISQNRERLNIFQIKTINGQLHSKQAIFSIFLFKYVKQKILDLSFVQLLFYRIADDWNWMIWCVHFVFGK